VVVGRDHEGRGRLRGTSLAGPPSMRPVRGGRPSHRPARRRCRQAPGRKTPSGATSIRQRAGITQAPLTYGGNSRSGACAPDVSPRSWVLVPLRPRGASVASRPHPPPAGPHVRPQDEDILRGASWPDLARHLRRIWRATTSLLVAQHPRFDTREARSPTLAGVRISGRMSSTDRALCEPRPARRERTAAGHGSCSRLRSSAG
jgi:hypothetical protein